MDMQPCEMKWFVPMAIQEIEPFCDSNGQIKGIVIRPTCFFEDGAAFYIPDRLCLSLDAKDWTTIWCDHTFYAGMFYLPITDAPRKIEYMTPGDKDVELPADMIETIPISFAPGAHTGFSSCKLELEALSPIYMYVLDQDTMETHRTLFSPIFSEQAIHGGGTRDLSNLSVTEIFEATRKNHSLVPSSTKWTGRPYALGKDMFKTILEEMLSPGGAFFNEKEIEKLEELYINVQDTTICSEFYISQSDFAQNVAKILPEMAKETERIMSSMAKDLPENSDTITWRETLVVAVIPKYFGTLKDMLTSTFAATPAPASSQKSRGPGA